MILFQKHNNMKTKRIHHTVRASMITLGLAVTAWSAIPIAVQNPGFEDDVLANGASVNGTAFDLPAGFANNQRVTLDLGEVTVMAKVTINDIAHDTLWRKPYQLDVTHDLKPGTNRIRVLVTSTSESKPAFRPTTLRAFQQVIVK